jgi:hypothetical protein
MQSVAMKSKKWVIVLLVVLPLVGLCQCYSGKDEDRRNPKGYWTGGEQGKGEYLPADARPEIVTTARIQYLISEVNKKLEKDGELRYKLGLTWDRDHLTVLFVVDPTTWPLTPDEAKSKFLESTLKNAVSCKHLDDDKSIIDVKVISFIEYLSNPHYCGSFYRPNPYERSLLDKFRETSSAR